MLAVGALLGACLGRIGLAAAPDVSADARGRSNISVARNDGGQIIRVIVRKGRLDAEMAAKLRGLTSLEALELFDCTLAPEVWPEITGLASLRLLKIRSEEIDFANLQRLAAQRSELIIDYPWPVTLYASQEGLVFQFPMADVVCRDIRPLAGFRQRLSCNPIVSGRQFGKVPLPRPSPLAASDFAGPSVVWYPMKYGAVCVDPFGRSFSVNNDASLITIGNRSFPIADRKRTVVIGEDGRAELRCFRLDLNAKEEKFEGGEELLSHADDEAVPDGWEDTSAGKGQQRPSAPEGVESAQQGALTDIERAIVTQYLESPTRGLTRLLSYHRAGWVFDMSPAVPMTSSFPARPVSMTGVASANWRRADWHYYPDVGISVLFKCDVPSHFCGVGYFRTGIVASRTRRGDWKLTVPGLAKPLEMRAVFSPDKGDLVCSLGDFSAEGDFRVNGKGRHVTVGDKTVELTPGVPTTILLSGNTSMGEPLRLERVETDEEE
jgi:hypothetical protein